MSAIPVGLRRFVAERAHLNRAIILAIREEEIERGRHPPP